MTLHHPQSTRPEWRPRLAGRQLTEEKQERGLNYFGIANSSEKFFFMKQTLFSHFTDSSIKNIIFWGYLFCTSCNVLRLDREEEWVVWHFTSDMFSNWTISFRSFYTTMSLCDCHFPFKSNLLLLLLRFSNLNQRTSWRLKGQRISHQI